jgi:hypothetical protein
VLESPLQVNEEQYSRAGISMGTQPRMDVLYSQVEKGCDLPLSLRLDLAASEVSDQLFGTFPCAVIRTVKPNCDEDIAVVKESTGSTQWFERKIWSLMSLLKEPRSEAQVQECVNRDREFLKKLEEAAVERLILGGFRHSTPEPYFAIGSFGSSYKILNIDLEGIFDPDSIEPRWENISSEQYQNLFNSLSNSRLFSETGARISSFLKCFDNAQGKEHLLAFGLYDDEVESLLARARWFDQYQQLPRCSKSQSNLVYAPATPLLVHIA